MGSVPTHWEILSLGQVGTLTKGNGGNKEDELPTGMPCVRYGDLYTTHKYFIENARSFISPEVADQYTKIKFGDVLFAASGETADEIGKSAVNLLRGPAYCGGDVILFRPHGHLIPRYTGYMMDCEPIVHQKATMGRGFTVYHVYGKQLKYLRIPIPPLEEQAAIVRFLDHADEQTQRYIAGKERLIALLEEERQALVHQAVTRGLDPNVRLKPSGVEWLGQVPEHWETLRVRHFSKVGNGCTPQRDNAAYWTEGVHPWLNSSSVNQGTITKADQFVTDLALSECHLPRLRPGSVLVGITGQGKTRGMSAVLCMDATINQHMAFITLKTGRVSSHYLHMYLTAAYSELRAISNSSGSTKDALTCEDIKHFMVVLPPRDEQERLLSEVRRELASVDNAVDLARRQIDLMNEYRTRLIADVVTGQLDVREAAEELPTPEPTEITD
jgi:type I restriction enzyme S subunit